jgi:5-(carboxyamino)imidazole ribonucleotide synthase
MTHAKASAPLPAGATIGILGGGQLGRMLAVAAAQLGYRTHVYDPEPECPASDVSASCTTAGYDDTRALKKFAASVDVVTFEFENVPAKAAARVATAAPLFPHADILGIVQDRLLEKSFALDLGIATPAFADVRSAPDLKKALQIIDGPAIVKTRCMGYDGKGQLRLTTGRASKKAVEMIESVPCIVEAMVPFTCEISIIAACSRNGEIAFYPPVQNYHESGILAQSRVPAKISEKAAKAAEDATHRIADALDYVGVFAVEYFVIGDRVIFNEIAPRVHNSGHWTIEGAVISQFENHIRAICGWPLGDTTPRGRIEMRNILGQDIKLLPTLLHDPAAHVHHYGKKQARNGRKMGHVTWVRP